MVGRMRWPGTPAKLSILIFYISMSYVDPSHGGTSLVMSLLWLREKGMVRLESTEWLEVRQNTNGGLNGN